jgi:hypothetical protein
MRSGTLTSSATLTAAGRLLSLCAVLLLGPALPGAASDRDVLAWDDDAGQLRRPTREERVNELRVRAQERIRQERERYSEAEVQDIEARYSLAHASGLPVPMLRRDAAPLLLELIAAYPESNRAGCAMVELAQLSAGDAREHYLKEAIARYSDAWFEKGVQVGAIARARLAIHYAYLNRFAEADQLTRQLVEQFPGAIDPSGAPLEDVVVGIRLLKPRE